MTIYSNKEIFNTIYRKHKWLFGSGSGSTPFFNRLFIKFVNNFLKEHPDIKVVVDMGCGDYKIGRKLALRDRRYIGCDTSDFIIKKNKSKFSSANKKFIHIDAVTDKLPAGDLVILKDALQHLCNRDVARVLSKIKDYRYVIIQNSIYSENISLISTNKDIQNGGFRPLDITKPPFNTEYLLAIKYSNLFDVLRHIFLFQPIEKGIFVSKKHVLVPDQ